ncbi:hypothetical protein ACFQL4_26740 [Halosimplex aquaticum]
MTDRDSDGDGPAAFPEGPIRGSPTAASRPVSTKTNSTRSSTTPSRTRSSAPSGRCYWWGSAFSSSPRARPRWVKRRALRRSPSDWEWRFSAVGS